MAPLLRSLLQATAFLAVLAAVQASPHPAAPQECESYAKEYQVLAEWPVAAHFCSSYLHIQPKTETCTKTNTVARGSTRTTISTVTARPTTTTVRKTVTNTSSATMSTTVSVATTTSVSTVTVPASTTLETSSCDESFFRANDKRDPHIPPPRALATCQAHVISSACSCLHLSTPTREVQLTRTVYKNSPTTITKTTTVVPRRTATSTITVMHTTTIIKTTTDQYATQTTALTTSTTTVTSYTSIYTETYYESPGFVLQVSSEDTDIDGSYLEVLTNGRLAPGAPSPVAAAFASRQTFAWFATDSQLAANVEDDIDGMAGNGAFVPVQFGGPGNQLACFTHCYGQWECNNRNYGADYLYVPFGICPPSAALEYAPNVLYFGTIPTPCSPVNLTVVNLEQP
ncbi:MAG: hypothetical protein M1828_005796 [Chrysothrix sp. TS-e1954]|nr:MAG: hypothetical protein M1828_005796 [Chrysothrix sp. TS-e1954]